MRPVKITKDETWTWLKRISPRYKAHLRYYATEGREIPVWLHNTRGPRPSWRSAFDVLTNRSVVTTRRDILLLPQTVNFSRLPVATTRFTSHFDGSLAPKVVQIIESYNNLHAFFVIFVFSGDFLRFSAQISGRSLRSDRVNELCE